MKIKLINRQRAGDVLILTAVVRDIKKAYPDCKIKVETSKNELFDNNPYIERNVPRVFDTASDEKDGGGEYLTLKVGYDDGDEKDGRAVINNRFSIHKVHEHRKHFIYGMVEYVNKQLDLNIEVSKLAVDVYLTEEEKKPLPGLPEKYWVVNMGYHDYSAKQWSPETWEKLIKSLPEVTFVQMGGEGHHPHFKADNLIDYTGKTTLRQALTLLYNSQGAVLPVTFAHHAMSMWQDKPCIVLGGGREQWWWEAYDYPKHHYLHTMGSFSCCPENYACWKDKCTNLVNGQPACLNLISPEMVIEIIKRHLT